jgi:nitrite reductase/ring-hydroxylating ferredoxin subunit
MESNKTSGNKGVLSKEELLEKGIALFSKKIRYACPVGYEFSAENKCMHGDCNGLAKERIIFGSEETIFEVDVCTKHAIYFRNASDTTFKFTLGYTPINK